jgi:hypothetical protein
MAGNVFADCNQTNWFSEEGSAKGQCAPGYAVKKIECRGSYCDNKRLTCCNDNMPRIWPNSNSQSSQFSEENLPAVGYGKVVVGMTCTGSYCDNLTLQYQDVRKNRYKTDYKWGPWFSEEQGSRKCDDSAYVVGVACKGRYCDNLALLCVSWN